MKKIGIAIIAVVVIAAIASGAYILTQDDPPVNNGEDDLDYTEPVFTDHPVVLLGTSDWTDTIVDTLNKSTSKISITENTDDLKNIEIGSLLFIDGYWLRSNGTSIQKVVNSLTDVFLKNIPIAMVGQTPYLLYAAIDEQIKGGKVTGYLKVNDEYRYSNGVAMQFDAAQSIIDVYEVSYKDNASGVGQRTTMLYNWSVARL